MLPICRLSFAFLPILSMSQKMVQHQRVRTAPTGPLAVGVPWRKVRGKTPCGTVDWQVNRTKNDKFNIANTEAMSRWSDVRWLCPGVQWYRFVLNILPCKTTESLDPLFIWFRNILTLLKMYAQFRTLSTLCRTPCTLVTQLFTLFRRLFAIFRKLFTLLCPIVFEIQRSKKIQMIYTNLQHLARLENSRGSQGYVTQKALIIAPFQIRYTFNGYFNLFI